MMRRMSVIYGLSGALLVMAAVVILLWRPLAMRYWQTQARLARDNYKSGLTTIRNRVFES